MRIFKDIFNFSIKHFVASCWTSVDEMILLRGTVYYIGELRKIATFFGWKQVSYLAYYIWDGKELNII